MIVHKGNKFRLYPDSNQAIMIRKSIGCVRFVFNFALSEQRKEENYWRIAEELVQNGALPKNNWKGDFFKDSKAQADLKELKRIIHG